MASRSVELNLHRILGQQLRAVSLGQFVTENGARGAVCVNDRQLDLHRLALFQSGLGQLEQLHIQHLVQTVILRLRAVGADVRMRFLDRRQDGAEIDTISLPVIDGLLHFQHIHAANHFIDGPETELRHQLPCLFGDHE